MGTILLFLTLIACLYCGFGGAVWLLDIRDRGWSVGAGTAAFLRDIPAAGLGWLTLSVLWLVARVFS